MSDTNKSINSLLARLHVALSMDSDLKCEQAEELLPLLVQAEAMGEDVSSDERLSALLRHFDTCEHCALAYATLSADLASVIDGPSEAVTVRPMERIFFEPSKEYNTNDWVLRAWQSAVRTLELVVHPQKLVFRPDVLGSGQSHQTIFSDRIPDLKGKPLFTVDLQQRDSRIVIHVVMRDMRGDGGWQVHLAAGEQIWEQQTDQEGVAVFDQLSLNRIEAGLTITCSEIVQEDQS